jgi:hypothetical protein
MLEYFFSTEERRFVMIASSSAWVKVRSLLPGVGVFVAAF